MHNVFIKKFHKVFMLSMLAAVSATQANAAESNWLYAGDSNGFAGSSEYQSLAMDYRGIPYVAFRSGDGTKVMKFNGKGWENIGGLVAEGTEEQSLAISSDGTPFVAYKADSAGLGRGKVAVKMFDGSKWVFYGTPGFSAGEANFLSLAIDDHNAINYNTLKYIAYRDSAYGNKTTVMMLDNYSNKWENVGNPGFSAGQANFQRLVIADDGAPYVAYQDSAYDGKTTVMTFDRKSKKWINVGNPGFSAGYASYISLALTNAGTPYIAYQDSAYDNKTTIMTLNGQGQWVNVGNPGFSVGGADYQSLAIGADGKTPYVAYSDRHNRGRTAVMKFNGSSWVEVGNPSAMVGAGTSAYQSLGIAPNGTMFVAYSNLSNMYNATAIQYIAW